MDISYTATERKIMMRNTATRYLLPAVIWTLFAVAAIGGLGGCSYLPFMKSEKAENKKVRTLWQSSEQYVAIEKQDQVPGVPGRANEHVSEISVDRLRNALASMEIRSKDSDKSVALFNEDELRILSEYIAEGLAVAGPDEDVTFAIIGHYVDALGFLKRRMVTTGRVFCQDGQLNIIFGDVHRLLTETMGKPEDRRLNPFAPGSRAGGNGKMDGFLLPKKDGEVFAKMREDWVIFPLKGPEPTPSETPAQEGGASEAGKGAQTPSGQTSSTPAAEVRKSAPATYHEKQVPPAKKGVEERLMQLNDLRNKKLITDEEYKAKRMEILNDL
ncbi:MAG TPA: SHOCT domain-containing protein [Geobacteraceae bacterium]